MEGNPDHGLDRPRGDRPGQRRGEPRHRDEDVRPTGSCGEPIDPLGGPVRGGDVHIGGDPQGLEPGTDLLRVLEVGLAPDDDRHLQPAGPGSDRGAKALGRDAPKPLSPSERALTRAASSRRAAPRLARPALRRRRCARRADLAKVPARVRSGGARLLRIAPRVLPRPSEPGRARPRPRRRSRSGSVPHPGGPRASHDPSLRAGPTRELRLLRPRARGRGIVLPGGDRGRRRPRRRAHRPADRRAADRPGVALRLPHGPRPRLRPDRRPRAPRRRRLVVAGLGPGGRRGGRARDRGRTIALPTPRR